MTDLISTDWKELDADNTSPSPNGVQGGYSPSQVAPVVRAIRGSLKRFYNQSNAVYTSTGTGAAYVLTFQAPPSGYSKGIVYRFWSHITNTGAATLNVNTLGAKAIVSPVDGSALTAGQIVSGKMVEVVYNGTAFELLTDMKQDSKLSGNTVLSGALSVSGVINADQNVNVKGRLYVGTSGTFLETDGNVVFSGGMASHGSNLGEAFNRKANLASPNFSGTVGLPGVSANEFKMGTADGASYSSYNIAMKGWWGMGMQDHTNTVNGYYDFRAGKWDTKGGTFKNGTEYVFPNGGMWDIAINRSASAIRDTGAVNGRAMTFNWSGQPGQPSWLWGGHDGQNMYVYQPANLTVLNSAQLGGLAASDYATKSFVNTSAGMQYFNEYAMSGTSIDIAGLPAGIKRLTLMFKNLNGTNVSVNPMVQLRTAAGVVTSGYFSTTVAVATGAASGYSSNGFMINYIAQTSVYRGVLNLQRDKPGGNNWTADGNISHYPGQQTFPSGDVALSADITGIRITSTAGNVAFTGTIAVWIEI